MSHRSAPRSPGLSRRGFLGLASAAVGLLGGTAIRRAWAGVGAGRGVAAVEAGHHLLLQLPVVTLNGAKVPIVVEMDHPMRPDHYIASVQVVNPWDPVPSKGAFHFTPANGRVHLSFQARMHHGRSEVAGTAECSRHGQWSTVRSINIPLDAGGCAAPVPPRITGDQILPPRIRIPELVKRGRIEPDQLIHVQLKIRHPNRTGLAFRDGEFVRESDPFHLERMDVFYGPDRVSRFEMTSALSDDPFITFALRANREAPLRVLLVNNRGQQFEAAHPIRFS